MACKDSKIVHKEKNGSVANSNNNTETYKLSPYEANLPKNEYNFMAPVREWERRVGFVTPLKWTNIVLISLLHIIAVMWTLIYVLKGYKPMWQTCLFGFFMTEAVGFGVTGGVHRLWSHRSYKAKLPLQIILMICYAAAGQNSIHEWVRDHRVHHKFSDTSADPHDVSRGFIFSHVGWLMMKKHPDVIKQGLKMDMSDIVNNPLMRLHTRYFVPLKMLLCFVLPTLVPRLWGESWDFCILSQVFLRYLLTLNITWSVNSFAHIWGNKPYDRQIQPTQNFGVALMSMGEGWHNYHHTFPWDYKASELAYTLNVTTVILDLFAKIGWAYDMKVASPSLVETVAYNKGDGSFRRVNVPT